MLVAEFTEGCLKRAASKYHLAGSGAEKTLAYSIQKPAVSITIGENNMSRPVLIFGAQKGNPHICIVLSTHSLPPC